MPDTLTTLENEANSIRERLSWLDKQIQSLKSLKDTIWSVPSRTNGRDHFVVLSGGNWSCHCEGAINGRECWALKGVRSAVTNNPMYRSHIHFNFYDDQYRTRTANRITAI
jgi:hypothetical protein